MQGIAALASFAIAAVAAVAVIVIIEATATAPSYGRGTFVIQSAM
jgi:hypothetical protein